MLYLEAPLPVIKGVSFIPDSRSDQDWYYLPLAPELVTTRDERTGTLIPKLELLRYRSDKGTGGFLSFDVRCSVPPEQLPGLATELQSMMNLAETPRLMPAPLTGGTVKLMLFDLESGQVADPANPLRFVRSISHNATPALYGQNEATFQVHLDQAGVTTLEAALKGDLSPIGIVYQFMLNALQPAYAVHLNIDWDRLQKHLDEKFGVDALFFSTDIGKAVDELIDERVIILEADTFVPEGEDEQATLARRDRAVAQVRDMITQSFFEPSLVPGTEPEDGWDKAAHFAESVSRLAVSGGASAFGGFSYSKKQQSRTDNKTLTVNMSERTTVKREIFPQAHLSGLFRVLTAGGVTLDRFVKDVELDDVPFFNSRRVKVAPLIDFDREAVSAVDVRLRYADRPPITVRFTKGSSAEEVSWPNTVVDGKAVREVQVDYTVIFDDVSGRDRPVSLSRSVFQVDEDIVEINTRELYEIVPVTVTALDVPWDRVAQVHVALSHQAREHGTTASDTVILTAASTETDWDLLVPRGASLQYSYDLTYRCTDHRDIVRPTVVTDDTTLTVRTPFPQSLRRVVEVVPVVAWDRVSAVFVDFWYTDKVAGIREEASLTFSADDAKPKMFGVDLVDPERRMVEYQVTVIGSDGRPPEVSPRSQTLDRRILVRPGMLGHRVVRVRPARVNFANARVERIVTELEYADPGNGVRFADEFTFTGPDDVSAFEFDFVDPAHKTFRYRTGTTFTNGLTSLSQWASANEVAELVIPVGLPG